MAHYQQRMMVEIACRLLGPPWKGKRVLELGSYSVNGTIRDCFPETSYTGVDLIPGPGVDQVYEGKHLNFPDKSFDWVISCECFEHNPNWETSLAEMFRVLVPGGILLVTCGGTGRIEHGTARTNQASPGSQMRWEYYRNLTKADLQRVEVTKEATDCLYFYNRKSKDLYYLAVKRGGPDRSQTLRRISTELLATNSINVDLSAPLWSRIARTVFSSCTFTVSTILPDKLYQAIAVRLLTWWHSR